MKLEKKNQRCLHSSLNHRDERSTMWFKIDDDDYIKLFKVLTDTRLCNSMKKCASFKHTARLEALHSSRLKYLPKLNSYTTDKTILMTMLVSLEHNLAMDCSTKVIIPQIKFSRAHDNFTVKNKVKVDRKTFKKDMIQQVLSNIVAGTPGVTDLSSYKRIPIPKTFHMKPKPTLLELQIRKHISRF